MLTFTQNNNMKKLIFAGCSYTYGAGIEREYTSEITTEFIPQEYKIKDCTYEQLEFIHQNRFSRLVEKHNSSNGITTSSYQQNKDPNVSNNGPRIIVSNNSIGQ